MTHTTLTLGWQTLENNSHVEHSFMELAFIRTDEKVRKEEMN